MPLPNADRAVLDRRKLVEYLLSETHPVGRHKARVFHTLGYRLANANRLSNDLLHVARTGIVTATSNTGFGHRYIVEGPVRTPTGAVVAIRTAWIIARGAAAPRFVTAYVLPPEES